MIVVEEGHGFGASYETSWWKCRRSSSEPSSRGRWWMVLLVGKTGLSSPFVE